MILENLRDMNQLWVRMNTLISSKEKRNQYRSDLGVTVAENLSLLSIFPDMDKEYFLEKVNPKILEIILSN